MSYENIDKVPVRAIKIGEEEITEEKEIEIYLHGKGFAFNHVINNTTGRFFEEHPEYLGRRIGIIPETEPHYWKPPEARLFIGFYDLNPKS